MDDKGKNLLDEFRKKPGIQNSEKEEKEKSVVHPTTKEKLNSKYGKKVEEDTKELEYSKELFKKEILNDLDFISKDRERMERRRNKDFSSSVLTKRERIKVKHHRRRSEEESETKLETYSSGNGGIIFGGILFGIAFISLTVFLGIKLAGNMEIFSLESLSNIPIVWFFLLPLFFFPFFIIFRFRVITFFKLMPVLIVIAISYPIFRAITEQVGVTVSTNGSANVSSIATLSAFSSVIPIVGILGIAMVTLTLITLGNVLR